MKSIHTYLTIIAIAAFAGFSAQAEELESTTPIAAKTNGEAWWNGQCARIDKDLEKLGDNIDVAFVGDSITARWKAETWDKHWSSYRAINMGIGGDQTQNALWRLKEGDLDGYKCKLFVVMIGTNNMWGKTSDPAHAAAGVKAVLDLIQSKHPESKILLMSILPTGEKPNPGRDKRKEVNALISKFAGGNIEYVDIWDKYLNAEGMISKDTMHDFLHLAPAGYDIWADAISAKVKAIVGEKK